MYAARHRMRRARIRKLEKTHTKGGKCRIFTPHQHSGFFSRVCQHAMRSPAFIKSLLSLGARVLLRACCPYPMAFEKFQQFICVSSSWTCATPQSCHSRPRRLSSLQEGRLSLPHAPPHRASSHPSPSTCQRPERRQSGFGHDDLACRANVASLESIALDQGSATQCSRCSQGGNASWRDALHVSLLSCERCSQGSSKRACV